MIYVASPDKTFAVPFGTKLAGSFLDRVEAIKPFTYLYNTEGKGLVVNLNGPINIYHTDDIQSTCDHCQRTRDGKQSCCPFHYYSTDDLG